MIKLGRVCVPIGLACDLDCKYCYRHAGKTRVPRLNDLMKSYLQQLDPKECRAVVASGGEPLLYLNRVKELFSYVPNGIHKKVMTNGTHLTQKIIDWFNEDKIELHFSHDGAMTKYFRGVDVLDDPEKCDLIRQAKILRVHSTVCAGNEDIMANYKYICDKLQRNDFFYTTCTFFGYEDSKLTDGFNFDLYTRSFMSYLMNVKRRSDHYAYAVKSNGLNVLPDGSICSMVNMHVYGTVENTMEEILQRKREMGDFDKCENIECPVRLKCGQPSQAATPHLCRVMKINNQITQYLNDRE